jgi:hypothetical protein
VRTGWPRCGQPFYASRAELEAALWRVCDKAWGHWPTRHRGVLLDPPATGPDAAADERPHLWPGKHTGGQM